MSVKTLDQAGRHRQPLVVESLEERVMLTLLTVLPNDQGVWTFRDADNQAIRLILSTGPNSGATIDVYDQNGDNMVFDLVAGGVYGTVAGVFTTRTDLSAGTAPSSVAVGDFNGDGNLDIAATNKGSDNIAVFLGTGMGTFGAPTFFSAGKSPAAIAVGRFNADARLDLAVATTNQSDPAQDYVSILLGDGAGGFGAPTNFAVGKQPSSIAVGDWNGDGSADLAVANSARATDLKYYVSILLGDGAGAFGSQSLVEVGNTPMSVVTGDFTKDGRLDLAVANMGADTVSILGGTGTGAFALITTKALPAQSQPVALAVGQFNNDDANTAINDSDYLDLVVVNQLRDNITVFYNDGATGTFPRSASYSLTAQSRPTYVAVGYFNNDTVLDIAVTNGAGDNIPYCVSVFLGAGGTTGSFSAPAAGVPRDYPVGSGPAWIAAGSFNTIGTGSDTRTDLVVANSTASPGTLTVLLTGGRQVDIGYIKILESDADTTLVINLYSQTDSSGTRAVTLDLFSGANDSKTSAFATLDYSAATAKALAPPNGAVWIRGDIFTDMGLDLAVVNYGDENIMINHGNGDGTFALSSTYYVTGAGPVSVVTDDFDNDGDLDLAVADYATGSVGIFLNNGKGVFTGPVTYLVGNQPARVKAGDLNGDGNIDLVVTNSGGDSISLLLGDGDGTFGLAMDFAVGVAPVALALTDLNSDGNLDVVVGNWGDGTITMLLGDGTGGFLASMSFSIGGVPAGIVAGDFNEDGAPDLAVPVYPAGTVVVFLGNGDGTFGSATAVVVGVFPVPPGLAVGDFDEDGHLDVVLTTGDPLDSIADFVTILSGDGHGNLGTRADFAVGLSPADLVVGDFNNDGHLDVAVANTGDILSTLFPSLSASTTSDGAVTLTLQDSPPIAPAGVAEQIVDVVPVSAVMLSNVPTSSWTYGCSATSAGMIFGYYDRIGYSNIYAGPYGGGVVPLSNLGGTTSLIATMNGFDGRITAGHVDDYWISYNSTGPDPWTIDAGGSGVEHAWASCTADFMGTNQWKWDFSGDGIIDYNVDGSTAYFSYSSGAKLWDYIPPAYAGLPQTELCHGLRLFAESRGYSLVIDPVTSNTWNYTQKTDNLYPGGFSFADYMAEIDAGYPVMIQVVGHSMVGVGYDLATQTVYLHDTWGDYVASMPWGGSYSGMDMVAVTVLHLAPLGIEPPPALPDTVSILIGNGHGNLVTASVLATGSGPLALAAGDFDGGRNRNFGTILIGGTFGVDDAHLADAVGGVGAKDGVINDNGAIRIAGNIGRISVGFLAGTIQVMGNLGELTVEGNAGFIQDSDAAGSPNNEFYNAGPTFYNASIFVGGDLGSVQGGGDWAIPIIVVGNSYGEAAQYTDASAGARASAAKTVRQNGEEFFQIVGTHSTSDGSDWYRFTADEGEDIHVFAPAGVPVRLYKDLGAGLVAVTGTLGEFVDGYGYAPHNTNYVVPAGEKATYYLATTWSYDDTNFDGVYSGTGETGPRDPFSYDIFVGITKNIVYEQEVLGEEKYYARKDAGRDDEETKPVTRGELVVIVDTNDTPETAEFAPLPGGTMVIHGVLQGGQDLDDFDTSSTRDDAYDNVDVYAIHVEAGTRIVAGLNDNFHLGVGSPQFGGFSINDGYAIKLGLLDADGNVLDSSYELASGWYGNVMVFATGFINYLADQGGTYYLAVSFHWQDNDFNGSPSADSNDSFDVPYEIFVTGSSTHQVFGGFDIVRHLGAGPRPQQGNITVLTGDLGWLHVGGNVYSPLVKVAGDLVHGQVGNLGNEAASNEPSRLTVLETDGNIHKLEAATLEHGYLDVGGDAYELFFSGDIGTGEMATRGMILVAGSIGILDVTGTIYGNGGGGSGYRPSIVVDYDLQGPPGMIDYIHAGQWGGGDVIYNGPTIVATGPGGNVRFVQVDGSVYFRDPSTGQVQTIGVKNITTSSPASDLTVRDDSGSELLINLDVDGPADPWETPEQNAPPATGSYQLVPIYGITSPSSVASMFSSGLSTLRFIGHAVDDFTLTGDSGSIVYLTATLGEIDLSSLALDGDINLSIFGTTGASVYLWEVTGGSTDTTFSLQTRGDVVGITGEAFKWVRIYDGSLGFTHSLSGTQTGYAPGTFTGPVLIQRYEPQDDNPDLYVSGLQLEEDIGDLYVSGLIVDVEVGGSVTREAAEDQWGRAVFSGAYHTIQANFDGVSKTYWLTGKVFEGLAGVIYVGGDVGCLDGAQQEKDGIGGIYVGDGLPHSGHGNHPLTGIFVGGTVTLLYATGPGHDISGDVFISQLGAQVTDNDPYDPKTWIVGGLILANGADLRNLYLNGSSSYDEAYDGEGQGTWVVGNPGSRYLGQYVLYRSRSSAGTLWRFQMSGANAEIWNTYIGYSNFNEVTITGGVGVHHAHWFMSQLTSVILTGTETGIHDAYIAGGTITRLEVAGWGFRWVKFNITGNVNLVKTTNSSIGDFNDVVVMIGGRLLELSSARDIIDMTLTTFQDAVLVKAARDVNGLVYQGTRLGRLEAGRNLDELDLTVAGEIDWVKATTGQITGTRIAALGPQGRINHVVAQGLISVDDIQSDGTITEIKSLGGSIDPTRIRAWGATVTSLWAAVDMADVSVVAWNIGTVYAGRDITRCQFIAGYDSVTGGFVSGRITSVTVGRNLVDSDFAAGVHPGSDGVFATPDDYGAQGGGTIGTFRVTGALVTTSQHGILADAGPFTVTRVSTATSLTATTAVQYFPGTEYKVMVLDYVGTVVGTGDVNGDGRSDIIAYTAEGAWWVGFSTGTSFTYKIMGLWSTAVTWSDVQVADITGDGKADVIGRTNAGQWWAGVSTGTSFTNRFLGTWSTAVTWSDVQVADINADGRDDVIGRTNAGQWWAGVSTGTSFTNRLLGTWSTAVTWSDVRVADLNGDGRDDVIGRTNVGQWWAGISTGTAFTNTLLGDWSTAVTWNDVRVADINGDGKADVIGRTSAGQWWAGISTGSALTNTLLGTWSTAFTWNDVRVADVNGDGKADVVARTNTGQWWAGVSTGSAFTNTFLGSWSTGVTWTNVQVGDFNGDNRDDVIGMISGSEHWWAGLATAAPAFVNQQFS
ncbi:MAG: FG-GAP-like repeat-containing protein [Planctomycetota bacterium]